MFLFCPRLCLLQAELASYRRGAPDLYGRLELIWFHSMSVPQAALVPPIGSTKSYSDMVKSYSSLGLSFGINMRDSMQINGALMFLFIEKELSLAENNVKHMLVLKFPKAHPYLDEYQLHIIRRWGLSQILIIGIIDAKNIMVMLKS